MYMYMYMEILHIFPMIHFIKAAYTAIAWFIQAEQ